MIASAPATSQRMPSLRLIAAPFTALHDDGALDLDPIEDQARALAAAGVQGAFVCGSTGEGLSLSTEERMAVAERWCAVAENLEVIVQVGHASVPEAARLAAHAQRAGAHAIATVAPFYVRPSSVAGLVDVCGEIAAAAPGLPFFYYHIPSATGVRLPMSAFLPQAADRLPTFRGIKYTDRDLHEYARCLDAAGSAHDVLFGCDEILLPALALGASAAVGSTYNFAAPLYQRLHQALIAGRLDEARRWQGLARSMIDIAVGHGGLPAMKALSAMLGLACGPCRPPFRTLASDEQQHMRAALERAGFFQALESAAGVRA